jgi:hypothetical protein
MRPWQRRNEPAGRSHGSRPGGKEQRFGGRRPRSDGRERWHGGKRRRPGGKRLRPGATLVGSQKKGHRSDLSGEPRSARRPARASAPHGDRRSGRLSRRRHGRGSVRPGGLPDEPRKSDPNGLSGEGGPLRKNAPPPESAPPVVPRSGRRLENGQSGVRRSGRTHAGVPGRPESVPRPAPPSARSGLSRESRRRNRRSGSPRLRQWRRNPQSASPSWRG